jgi:hypothetical protein
MARLRPLSPEAGSIQECGSPALARMRTCTGRWSSPLGRPTSTREEEPFERVPSERVQLLRFLGNTVPNKTCSLRCSVLRETKPPRGELSARAAASFIPMPCARSEAARITPLAVVIAVFNYSLVPSRGDQNSRSGKSRSSFISRFPRTTNLLFAVGFVAVRLSHQRNKGERPASSCRRGSEEDSKQAAGWQEAPEGPRTPCRRHPIR